MSKINESLLTWPAKIWLQREDENEPYINPFNIFWCEDAVNEGDVTYIRADLTENQIGALKAELEEAREIIAGLTDKATTYIHADDAPRHEIEVLGIHLDIIRRARAFIAKMEAGNE